MKRMKAVFAALREMHRLEKRLIPIALTVAVIMAVMPFVNVWFTAKIVDLLDVGANMRELAVYIALAVGINLVLGFFNTYFGDVQYMFRSLMYNKELQSIAGKLYTIEYKKLEDSDFKELVHKHAEAQDRVFSAFVQFTWMMRDFVSGMITLVISVGIIFPPLKIGFVTTGDAFFEKPIFLLTLFGAIMVMTVIMLIVALRMNKAYFRSADEYSRLDRVFYFFLNLFTDYKTGKEIRLYKEQDLIERTATDAILTDGEKVLRKASLNSAKSGSFVAVLGAVVGFGIYLFIGVKGHYGLFGIGSLVLYCGSFMQIINGIMKMAATFGKTEEMVPLVNYYFAIMQTTDEMTYGERELDLSDTFEIAFYDVSFRYPGSEDYALRHINITIRSGEKLAVVGRNGSGKTTFIKLLCRFYDVTEGQILINGIDIRQYSKDSLQKLYSVVFQDYKIFSTTLAQNVSASNAYDEQRLYASLDKANMKDRVLKMEKREQTYLYKDLDQSGVEISGGEAQKLALARALYKDAPVVILDEPTAALDPIAEYEIYNRFNSFVEGKTAIYISHRLSSCAFCDKIAVFHQARLEELGTHQELLAQKGKYAELWHAQAVYYQ